MVQLAVSVLSGKDDRNGLLVFIVHRYPFSSSTNFSSVVAQSFLSPRLRVKFTFFIYWDLFLNLVVDISIYNALIATQVISIISSITPTENISIYNSPKPWVTTTTTVYYWSLTTTYMVLIPLSGWMIIHSLIWLFGVAVRHTVTTPPHIKLTLERLQIMAFPFQLHNMTKFVI